MTDNMAGNWRSPKKAKLLYGMALDADVHLSFDNQTLVVDPYDLAMFYPEGFTARLNVENRYMNIVCQSCHSNDVDYEQVRFQYSEDISKMSDNDFAKLDSICRSIGKTFAFYSVAESMTSLPIEQTFSLQEAVESGIDYILSVDFTNL